MGSILVIDDDRDSREAVARYLKKAGYAVHTAPNGREALIAVATTIPDVIVLDAMMPEMNGIEFLKVIRSYLRWSRLPVVLLTAYPEGPHIAEARLLGVKCIFRKAEYKLEDLLACVFELIQGRESNCSGGIGA